MFCDDAMFYEFSTCLWCNRHLKFALLFCSYTSSTSLGYIDINDNSGIPPATNSHFFCVSSLFFCFFFPDTTKRPCRVICVEKFQHSIQCLNDDCHHTHLYCQIWHPISSGKNWHLRSSFSYRWQSASVSSKSSDRSWFSCCGRSLQCYFFAKHPDVIFTTIVINVLLSIPLE